MKSSSETADYCSRCGADLQIVSLKFTWRGVETSAACPECTTIASAGNKLFTMLQPRLPSAQEQESKGKRALLPETRGIPSQQF